VIGSTLYNQFLTATLRCCPRHSLHSNPAANPRRLQKVSSHRIIPFPTHLLIPNRAALRTHPDRVASDSPERAERTRKFQQVNDAYYTLSDPSRRGDYDAARIYHGFGSGASTASTAFDSDAETPPRGADDAGGASGAWGSFPWSSFGFGKKSEDEKKEAENEQFGDVFEEMLREEGLAEDGGKPTGKVWSVVGGVSGGAMGFIIANFPGMLAGAVAGNRLGSIRDARGKSVYSVFQELPQDAKMQLLSQLAVKVFSHAVGS
jgi:curved DNA-binding protein CbpA